MYSLLKKKSFVALSNKEMADLIETIINLDNVDIIIEYFNRKHKCYPERKLNFHSAKICCQVIDAYKLMKYEIRIKEKRQLLNYIIGIPEVKFESNYFFIFMKEYECKLTITTISSNDIESLNKFFSDVRTKKVDVSNKENINYEDTNSKTIDIDKLFDDFENNKECNIKKYVSTPEKLKLHEFEKYSPIKKKLSNNKLTPTKFTKCNLISPKKYNLLTATNKYLPMKSHNSNIISSTKDPKFDTMNGLNDSDEKFLNSKQLEVLECCKKGFSVFFSGEAGSGKTFLLTKIIEILQSQHGNDAVFITATTGLAASAIGGTTVHQFAGLNSICEDDHIDHIISKILSKPKVVQRWRDVKVLVIDEISMLNPFILEILQEIAFRIRGNNLKTNLNKSFCGIQLIVAGDFYQLPPVSQKTSVKSHDTTSTRKNIKFCFQSKAWKNIISKTFILDKIYRQNDETFVSYLEQIRRGCISDELLCFFNSCVHRKIDSTDGILPTRLFTHRCDVDIINNRELSNLPGRMFSYQSIDSGDDISISMLNSNCLMKSKLNLKIGAQVILVKTISSSEGLVNGTKGVVTKFNKESNRPVIRFSNGIERTIHNQVFSLVMAGKTLAKRSQLPLDLAWALSIHKSQGMTLDKAIIDLRKVFECGQTYVALSRVKDITGLSLTSSLKKESIISDPLVKEFYDNISNEINN